MKNYVVCSRPKKRVVGCKLHSKCSKGQPDLSVIYVGADRRSVALASLMRYALTVRFEALAAAPAVFVRSCYVSLLLGEQSCYCFDSILKRKPIIWLCYNSLASFYFLAPTLDRTF